MGEETLGFAGGFETGGEIGETDVVEVVSATGAGTCLAQPPITVTVIPASSRITVVGLVIDILFPSPKRFPAVPDRTVFPVYLF